VDEAPVVRGYEITKDGDVYVLSGASIDSLTGSVNFEDYESLSWFHRTMRRSGIIDALREKGCQEGDTVRMGDMEFDFVE
jgi:GTP-binding protein